MAIRYSLLLRVRAQLSMVTSALAVALLASVALMIKVGLAQVEEGVPLRAPVDAEKETPLGSAPPISVATRSTTGSVSPVLVNEGDEVIARP